MKPRRHLPLLIAAALNCSPLFAQSLDDDTLLPDQAVVDLTAAGALNRAAVHEQNAILVGQNQLLQQQLDVLTANYDSLAASRENQFFLYGGLLVFLGACLSALVPRLRGRKKLGEWG